MAYNKKKTGNIYQYLHILYISYFTVKFKLKLNRTCCVRIAILKKEKKS